MILQAFVVNNWFILTMVSVKKNGIQHTNIKQAPKFELLGQFCFADFHCQ